MRKLKGKVDLRKKIELASLEEPIPNSLFLREIASMVRVDSPTVERRA